ncbi:MAG: type II toxin-antitoxin system RelE/ParE family toxin [bacterium]
MAELIWGGVAISDLECIYDYIARDSHHYARHQIERISHSVERLRQFPESGRRLPEFPYLPHREVLIDNYRVIYRYAADSDRVFIVTVAHGHRLLEKSSLNPVK